MALQRKNAPATGAKKVPARPAKVTAKPRTKVTEIEEDDDDDDEEEEEVVNTVKKKTTSAPKGKAIPKKVSKKIQDEEEEEDDDYEEDEDDDVEDEELDEDEDEDDEDDSDDDDEDEDEDSDEDEDEDEEDDSDDDDEDEDEEDDDEEDEDEDEDEEEEEPVKPVKKASNAPAKKSPVKATSKKAPAKQETKKASKSTSKKAEKKAPVERRSSAYQFEELPTAPDVEPETFVTREMLSKIIGSRMNEIMSSSARKTAENFLSAFDEVTKELFEQHCELTLLSNKRCSRRFIKARVFDSSAMGSAPTLIPPHFEMKMPVYYDSAYEGDKTTLISKNGKNYIKSGKNTIEVTKEYLEELDEAFKAEHPNSFPDAKPAKKATKKASAKAPAKKTKKK